MEQGTGKTLTTLKIIGNYYKKGLINNVLILCPKSVILVWKEELHNLLIPYEIVTDPLSPSSLQEKLTICLINYEALKKYKGKSNKLKKYWDFIVADESHRLKNPNSIQSKQSYFFARGSKYRIALSGTPKGNSDFDFFGQYRFINEGIFGPKTSIFKKEYFDPCGWMGHDLKLKDNKKEKFYQLVNDHSFRITKNEALDLPPIMESKILIDLSPKNQKIYDKLKEEKLIKLKDEQITADLAITLVTKLQQICCGFIYGEDHEVIQLDKLDKVNCLLDLLKDISGKIVIFTKYKQDIILLNQALKAYKKIIYDGNSKEGEWKKFVDKEDIKILITQIKKGGTGLNLQCASTVIFYNLSYSYIDISQAKDRVYRNGQLNKVMIYYLICKNTIEESIFKTIKGKQSGAKQILDDYRKTIGFDVIQPHTQVHHPK